jgi:hypothetical protein
MAKTVLLSDDEVNMLLDANMFLGEVWGQFKAWAASSGYSAPDDDAWEELIEKIQ